jgi:hypothetical protein
VKPVELPGTKKGISERKINGLEKAVGKKSS